VDLIGLNSFSVQPHWTQEFDWTVSGLDSTQLCWWVRTLKLQEDF